MIGALLYIIAGILLVPSLLIGGTYGLLTVNQNDYLRSLAVAIDRMGNVILAPLFNKILITKEGYKFGNGKETMSSVIGKNEKTLTLKELGIWLSLLLDWMDENHCENSIDNNV